MPTSSISGPSSAGCDCRQSHPADVAEFVTARQAEAKGWTIKGDLTALSGVFQHATRHMGFTGPNPIAVLDRDERPHTRDKKVTRVLNPEEVNRLIAAIPPQYRLLFEVAADTGARLSEVLGLVWGEVDLSDDDAAIRITRQLQRKTCARGPLKTDRSNRRIDIDIDYELATKLKAAKLAALDSSDHAFVFVSRQGTPHDHRNIGGRVLAAAVKQAGLEAVVKDGIVVKPAPTFHHLRHTHGLSSGCDRRVGHRRGVRAFGSRRCLDHEQNIRPRVRPGPTQQVTPRASRTPAS